MDLSTGFGLGTGPSVRARRFLYGKLRSVTEYAKSGPFVAMTVITKLPNWHLIFPVEGGCGRLAR
jgi:hypothetical protein